VAVLATETSQPARPRSAKYVKSIRLQRAVWSEPLGPSRLERQIAMGFSMVNSSAQTNKRA